MRTIGTSGIVILVVVVATTCGTDDAAGGSLDSSTPAATTPAGAPPTLLSETVAATLESGSPDTSNPRATVTSGSATDTTPITLGLDGVPPESVPMVISEHLISVQQAVRTEVGEDVFAGSAFTDAENDTLIIYATDVAAATAALDRLGTPLRDRITVAERRYSVSDIETYAEQVQNRLDAAGITASLAVQFGLDAVAVRLETPDGQPDENLEAQARSVLDDIPVVISFAGPEVLL